jgi:hypothetical protein
MSRALLLAAVLLAIVSAPARPSDVLLILPTADCERISASILVRDEESRARQYPSSM